MTNFRPYPKTGLTKKKPKPLKRKRRDTGYIKLYLDHFGFTSQDEVFCEVCAAQAIDIHHIKARGMGGTKVPDTITNLMALCRECHIQYGDKKQWKEMLIEKHMMFLKSMSTNIFGLTQICLIGSCVIL